MNRITVLASREKRLEFLSRLKSAYGLSDNALKDMRDIPLGGNAYLGLRLENNKTLILHFLSDREQRYSGIPISRSFKPVEAVLLVGDTPALFKPHIKDEMIQFKSEDFALTELMKAIYDTPTAREALEFGSDASSSVNEAKLEDGKRIHLKPPKQETLDKVSPQYWLFDRNTAIEADGSATNSRL